MLSFDIDNQLILNIIIHVCILFIFLYIFFFLFISKKGEYVLNKNIKDLSDNNVDDFLKEIDEKYGKNIDWKSLREKSISIRDNPNNEINKSNSIDYFICLRFCRIYFFPTLYHIFVYRIPFVFIF